MNQILMPIQDIYGYTYNVILEDWIGTTYQDKTATFEFAGEDYYLVLVVSLYKALMITRILNKVLER